MLNNIFQSKIFRSEEGTGGHDPMAEMNEQKKGITKHLEGLQQQQEQVKQEVSQYKQEINRLNFSEKARLEKGMVEIDANIKQLESEISGFEKLIDNDEYSEEQKDQWRKELIARKEQLQKLRRDKDAVQQQLQQLAAAVAQYQQGIQQRNQALQQITAEIEKYKIIRKGVEARLKMQASMIAKQKLIQADTKKKHQAIDAEQGANAA